MTEQKGLNDAFQVYLKADLDGEKNSNLFNFVSNIFLNKAHRFYVDQNSDNKSEFRDIAVGVHELLLSPLLGSKSIIRSMHQEIYKTLNKLVEHFENNNKVDCLKQIHNCLKDKIVASDDSVCVATGSIFRTSYATNARVSKYNLNEIHVFDLLKKRVNSTFPENEKMTFVNNKFDFFSELLGLYFSIFGRGNTLNEFLLDRVAKPNTKVLHLSFENAEESPEKAEYFTYNNQNPDILEIKVYRDLWHALIYYNSNNEKPLNYKFWLDAWNIYKKVKGENKSGNLNADWVAAATIEMGYKWNDDDFNRPLKKLLKEARSTAERKIFAKPGNLVKYLKEIYGEDFVPTDSLKQLLLMIQGSLCLIPWAEEKASKAMQPLPVFTIPAIEKRGEYHCGWTIIPRTTECLGLSWEEFHDTVSQLFEMTHSYYYSLVNRKGFTGKKENKIPWEADFGKEHTAVTGMLHKSIEGESGNRSLGSEREENNSVDKSEKKRLEDESKQKDFEGYSWEKFKRYIKVAQNLTGNTHEGKQVSFCLIFGSPVVLKYIEKVVSNENLPEDEENKCDSAYLENRFTAHYSIFQQPGIAAFIDQYSETDSIDKIIVLKSPSEDEMIEFISEHEGIIDDEYRNLRWLTSKLNDPNIGAAVALLAEGDGLLRIFHEGKLVLIWNKWEGPEGKRWKFGIEYKGKQDSTQNSRLEKLKSKIRNTLKIEEGASSSFLKDLITAIISISDKQGEGALFIFSKLGRNATELCDMVPDSFKMQWAKDRRLSDVEHKILQHMAVMDGAIHITTSKPNNGSVTDSDIWVCARRYVAAAPVMENDIPLSATVIIKEYFENWKRCIKDYSFPEERDEQRIEEIKGGWRKNLDEWRYKLGKAGTRHRSVFQFLISYLEREKPIFDNEIKKSQVRGNSKNGNIDEKDSPLICIISADGPVNLFQLKMYKKNRNKDSDIKEKGIEVAKEKEIEIGHFLMIEKIVS